MDTHIKALAVLQIVLGALGVLGAFFVFLVFGGAAGLVGASAEAREALIAIPILGLAGGLLALFILVLSVPGIIAGLGLLRLRPWARVLTLILCAFNLLNVPLGTVIGVYGLWVLLSNEGAALFTAERPAAPGS